MSQDALKLAEPSDLRSLAEITCFINDI